MSIMETYAHGQFSWVDLSAHDKAAAEQFYGQLFGWKVVPQDTHGGPPYAQLELDGHAVAGIGQMSEDMKAQGVPPMWNSYINVDDVEAAAARAKELGGQIMVPPMKVLDAGWLAFVTDPTGATFGLWQKDQHIGATLVQEPGSLCWNELSTRDQVGAREFYGTLLGWSFSLLEVPADGPPTEYHIIKNQAQDNGGIIQMNAEWGELPPHWMVYFSVADIDASVARVAELGGNVHVPQFDTSVGRIAVVADPQGAVFSLIQLASS